MATRTSTRLRLSAPIWPLRAGWLWFNYYGGSLPEAFAEHFDYWVTPFHADGRLADLPAVDPASAADQGGTQASEAFGLPFDIDSQYAGGPLCLRFWHHGAAGTENPRSLKHQNIPDMPMHSQPQPLKHGRSGQVIPPPASPLPLHQNPVAHHAGHHLAPQPCPPRNLPPCPGSLASLLHGPQWSHAMRLALLYPPILPIPVCLRQRDGHRQL